MNIGIFQCDGGGLTPDERLSKLETNLRNTSLDMIVCPELFASGYNAADKLINYADEIIGDISLCVAELASDMDTAIVYGYPEKDGDKIYNSAACINSNGEILANHRKLMLPPGFELNYFTPGTESTLFEIDGITFALLICYDVEYPEAVRYMAQAGAQAIIVPTALADSWGIVSEKLIPTRAFENGVWLVYANHSGVENGLKYYGGSCIVVPNGDDAARADSNECVISADIDIESVLQAQARLPYLRGAEVLREKL
jgi:predicted amidohydrolase